MEKGIDRQRAFHSVLEFRILSLNEVYQSKIESDIEL